MPLSSGTRLGSYIVEALIGAGGMGEVYKTYDSRLHRPVAVKVLAADLATPERLHRFEQEARSASALNHPNILTIYDVGREGDLAYFAMEWVEGQSLRDLIAGGRLPLRRVLDLCHQIVEGLAKAHAAGIVHRDLKPENVMVSGDGFAKIVDFGLAKLAEGSGAAAETRTRTLGTTPGLIMGTVGYMSPEQATGRPVDYRSDQFALGLLIYELATGRRPFVRPTDAQSIAATIEADPEPVERLNPQVPPHLAAVVARCLAKDPAERYESTRDLARDMKQILKADSLGTIAAGAAAPRRWRAPAPAMAALIIIAVVLAIASTVWLWRSPPRAPVEPPRPLVAVRIFRNLSPDPAQSYFAAGMTEEIRGQLSQVSALRLLSRNAVDSYPDADVPRMVRELGVRNLVEGSVRLDGERVRISAELIDGATRQTLWAEQYDRDLADVFAVQSDVALRIAQALQANLSPDERQRVEQRPTNNIEAYRLYLQSQELEMSERAANLAGIDLLRKALALDSTFAVAQARLAYRQIFMGYYDDPSWVDKGLAEIQVVLRRNPSVGYGVLATAYAAKGRDSDARLAFLRELELKPSNSGAMSNLSVLEGNHGRFDESLHWARRAFALSGKRGNDFFHLSVPLLALRDDALTRRVLMEGEQRSPDFNRLQMVLAYLEVFEGRIADAQHRLAPVLARSPADEEIKMAVTDVAFLAESAELEPRLKQLMKTSPSNAVWVSETVRLRYAYALMKRSEAARAAALVDEAESMALDRIAKGNQIPDLRIELAAVSALRRDLGAAIEWLSRAYDAGYRHYGFLELDPIMAPLRSDERFREILERMRRDLEAQRQRARERGLLDLEPLIGAAK